MPGIFSRTSAMASPGNVLSQAPMPMMASNICPRATNSTESAITSRETSEAFIPSVPIVTPSETEMVFSSCGVPPAANALLDVPGQIALVEVAGHGLDPAVSNADDRTLQVFVVEAGALQHGAGASAIVAVKNDAALVPHVEAGPLFRLRPLRHRAHSSKLLLASRFSLLALVPSMGDRRHTDPRRMRHRHTSATQVPRVSSR